MGFFSRAVKAVATGGFSETTIRPGKKALGLLSPKGPESVKSQMSQAELDILKQRQALLKRFSPIFGDFAADIIGGKVPVDERLEQELGQRESAIKEDIARRGGSSGSALSTAGIQRLGQFQTGADIARGEARRSLIPSAFQAISSLGGLSQQALAPLQQERQLQLGLSQQRAQQEAQRKGGLGQLVGGALSGAITGTLSGIGPFAGAGLGALGGGGAIPFLGGRQGGGGAGTLQTPQLQMPQTSVFPQRQNRFSLRG